ncbi:MAG: 50S ribosomal protein L18 [Alphaproteobacteria bacterium]
MALNAFQKNERRKKRVRFALRKKVSADCPRLSVFRANKNIYAQVIDDTKGVTVVSASTLDPDLKKALKAGSNIEAAKAVGKLIGERALKAGVKAVVFDRGGRLYHGRVKAVAEGAREAGLKF